MEENRKYKKQFNGEDWYIRAFMYNTVQQQTYQLEIDCITSLEIYNSIESYYPTLKLLYIDYGFNMSAFLNGNGIFIEIELLEPQRDLNLDQNKYRGIFFLSDIKVVDQDRESITFSIDAIHISALKLLKTVNYSNNKEQGKISPYKIISDICNKINCDFDTDYLDTTNKIDFISSQTMNAIDIISYCLKSAVTYKHSPSYFLMNLFTNTYFLFNQFHFIDKYMLTPSNLHLVINLDENDADTNKTLFISDVLTSQPIGRNR